ncbi:flagellar protein FlgN [Paenibacillus enshidis]|uniref:Flagellar protein FlgN n=1 Tax=Paenibacillus enshidis TaxID=1458439 RepID=A0ABV5AR83_9BACL
MPLTLLLGTLERLNEAHLQLIELGLEKKEALIRNQVDHLIAVMTRESRMSKRIEQLEQERVENVHLFLQERGIKSRLNLTIRELSRLVFEQEEKQRLLQIQSALGSTLKQLKELNDLNQQLIQQAISYIDFSIESMSYYSESEVTYTHPAEKQASGGRRGLFDTRA